MSNFRLVFSSIWTGKTGREVRKMLQKGKYNISILYHYLLTCPSANQYGVYYLPLDVVSFETGLTADQVKEAFNYLTKPLGSPSQDPYKGTHPFTKTHITHENDINNTFCSYDHEHEYVWIHNMANYQIKGPLHPADKQVIGVNNYLKTLPELAFLKDFYQKYSVYLKLESLNKKVFNNDPNSSPLQGPSKHLVSTDTNTDTNTDTDKNISLVEQARPIMAENKNNIVPLTAIAKKDKTPSLNCYAKADNFYYGNRKDDKKITNSDTCEESKHLPDAKNILTYLNKHAGTQFREVPTHFKFIIARLGEGATPEQCIDIINRKIRAWKNDPRMSLYLRPQTLFNKTKFEQYIGERVVSDVAYHNLTPGEKYLLAVSTSQEKFMSPDNRQIAIEH